MRTLLFLEDHDRVQPDDWCRPLKLTPMSAQSDYYSDRSNYSGTPMNNMKWVQVKHVFGPVWYNKPVAVLCKLERYEFVRGEVPQEHQLDMTSFNSLV